jgi:polygalacturonase
MKHAKIRFLIVALSFSIIVFSCGATFEKSVMLSSANSWQNMQKIIDSIKVPVFSEKKFNVLNYGAQSDGTFDNTKSFHDAIKDCTKSGGGIVLVPSGKYLTGPIHLENNVNLFLEENAEILFSTNTVEYPIVHTSFEGTELMNYSPLIYAYNKSNIAITGKGVLNGQANNNNWWFWSGKDIYGWKKGMPSQADPLNRSKLVAMAEEAMPVSERIFGEGRYLRPNFIEFFGCKNVLLEGVKIINAPFWVIHPIKSKDVIIDGVVVESHGPNNDGCDPEYSKNVIIRNCTFNTGDDCIAIKSGRDADGRRVSIKTENIIVQNCKMFDGHGGVTIGSEISSGVSNVFVENCAMDSPELDRAIRIKTNTKRGGLVENLYVRNITVGQVKESVLGIDMFYSVYGNQTGNFMPKIRNIYLQDIKVKNGGQYGILAKGHKESPIENINLINVVIDKVQTKYDVQNVKGLNFINTRINGILTKKVEN